MNTKNEKINTLILVLCICHNFIMNIISDFIKINNLFIFYLFGLFLISILLNKFKINKIYLVFQISALVLIFSNILMTKNNSKMIEYLLYFISYSIMGGYILINKFSTKYFLEYVLLIYFAILPIFIMKNFSIYEDTTLMTITYSILPGILVSISVLFNIFEKSKIVKKIMAIIVIVGYGNFLIKLGSRGIILGILKFLLLIVIINIKNKYNKIAFILTISIIGIYLKSKLYSIIIGLGNILSKYNIYSEAISKTIWQINNRGNITSNRNIIYANALDLIKKNKITGIGIGTFEAKYNIFPHNIFYQIWLEWGGIVVFIFLIFILISLYLICFYKNISREERFMSIMLFSLSIPQLLVSSVYWRTVSFWMFFLYQILIMNKIYKKHKKGYK